MRYMYRLCLLAFIAVLFMITVIDNHSVSSEHSTQLGLFDLNNKLESQEFYTDLDGEWYFFEKELLTPREVKEQLKHSIDRRVVSLPSSFKTQTGEVNSFGTYSAIIRVPKKYVGEILAIHIPVLINFM